MNRAAFIRQLLADGPIDAEGIRRACASHGYPEPSAQAIYSAKNHPGVRGGAPRCEQKKPATK
jgi:hypothetical protein